jgi:hypothetical protein
MAATRSTFAALKSANDVKQHSDARPIDRGDLSHLLPGGEIEHDSLAEAN